MSEPGPGPLSPDLIARPRDRAADAERRSDAPQPGETSFLGGAFKTVRVESGQDPAVPQDPAPLPAPASADDIAAAEARLGFALPDDLKQLYSEVANGGFGPGDGFAALEGAAARYQELIAESVGEGGQDWPKHLLPVTLTEPGADCYDCDTGAIVLWDWDVLADGPGDDTWQPPSGPRPTAWRPGWRTGSAGRRRPMP